MFAAWGIAVRRLHMCEQVYCGLYNIYIFYQKPVSRNQNNYRQVKETSRQLPRSREYPVPPQKKVSVKECWLLKLCFCHATAINLTLLKGFTVQVNPLSSRPLVYRSLIAQRHNVSSYPSTQPWRPTDDCATLSMRALERSPE